jgi:hypothetical protein
LFVILIIIPVRIVSDGYNIDLANYNIVICKIEMYTFNSIRTISCWLIVLACIDRYFNSSPNAHIRQFSCLKTAKLGIIIISITMLILYSHMIIYYDIYDTFDQFGNIVPKCYDKKGIYHTFRSFWYMTLYSICPSLLMFIFGILTLYNLRQQRRVSHRVVKINLNIRRSDTQLLRMLIGQVVVIMISTFPFTIYQLYVSFTLNSSKNTFELALENLFSDIARVMTYFAHSTSFYLYTLTGTIFRKELFKIVEKYIRRNGNRIHNIPLQIYPISTLQRTR